MANETDPKALRAIKRMRIEARAAMKEGADPFAVYEHLRSIDKLASDYLGSDEG